MQKWWSFLWLDCRFVGTFIILSYHFCVYVNISMIESIWKKQKERIPLEILLPRLPMSSLLLNIMNTALSSFPWQLSPQTIENTWQRRTSQRGRGKPAEHEVRSSHTLLFCFYFSRCCLSVTCPSSLFLFLSFKSQCYTCLRSYPWFSSIDSVFLKVSSPLSVLSIWWNLPNQYHQTRSLSWTPDRNPNINGV